MGTMEASPPDKKNPASITPSDALLKMLAQTWNAAEKLLAVPPPPMLKDHIDVAGEVILIGGGISGESIVKQMRNNDLLAEQVPPKTYDPTGMYQEMVNRQKLKGRDIVVITSASRKFNESGGEDLKAMFGVMGVKNVHVIDTHDCAEVDTPQNLQALKDTPFIFIDGGDQKFLAELFRESEAQNIIRNRMKTDKNFTLAGTSAGAMIVSGMMMHGGEKEHGFDLLPIVVDTHFTQRNRSKRLEKLLMEHGAFHSVAIGVDEGAAVKIAGHKAEIFHAGDTQHEQENNNPQPKAVMIMTKNPDAAGAPVIEKREYICTANQCVLSFTNKAVLGQAIEAEKMDPTIPVVPLPAKGAIPAAPLNAPMRK